MKTTDLISKIMLMGALVATGCSSDNDEPNGVKEAERPKIELTAREAKAALDQRNFQIDMFSDYVSTGFAPTDTNLTISPLSSSVAMSILANAADDETAKRVADIMDCDDLDALNDYNTKLLNYLPYEGINAKLKLASNFWYNEKETIDPAFEARFTAIYGSKPQASPFDITTVNSINKWVSDKTDRVFNSIVNMNTLNDLKDFFFANVLYYKGVWVNPFNSGKTTTKEFKSAYGTQNVAMMHQENHFKYSEVDGTKVVRLPYSGDHISMFVILPPESEDVIEFAKGLNSKKFNSLTADMFDPTVDLQLPKFKVLGDNALTKYLLSKGISTQNIVLSGAGLKNKIDFDMFQKTMIEVDEKGTVLAAVTYPDGPTAPTPPTYVDFHANRPFIYVIQEEVSGAVLMAGIIRYIPKENK